MVALNIELTVEERNLFSVAYKNVIGARRASWRIISSISQKEKSRGNQANANKAEEYNTKITKELHDVATEVINVIETLLIPNAQSEESVCHTIPLIPTPTIGTT